ncbi:hypothetical protein [Pasteuria penetrans]|uniref:hypothetical protein n=1 Tax=Pasteuria penetrans TaxID=86005 RepID=UPI000F935460|nr:hypothetical protein [Pasteuria penetrans]
MEKTTRGRVAVASPSPEIAVPENGVEEIIHFKDTYEQREKELGIINQKDIREYRRQREILEKKDPDNVVNVIGNILGSEDRDHWDGLTIQSVFFERFGSLSEGFLKVVGFESSNERSESLGRNAFSVFLCVYLGSVSYRATAAIWGHEEKFRKIHREWWSNPDFYREGARFLVTELRKRGLVVPRDRIRALQYFKRIPPKETRFPNYRRRELLTAEILRETFPKQLKGLLVLPSDRKEGSPVGRPRGTNVYLILEIIYHVITRGPKLRERDVKWECDTRRIVGARTVAPKTIYKYLYYWRISGVLPEIITTLLTIIQQGEREWV